MRYRDNLRKAFYERLAAAVGSTQIGFENQKFEQPQDELHLMAYFREMKSKRAAIGTSTRFNRHWYGFMVDVIVPEKSGTASMLNMCDTIAGAFEDINFALDDGSYVTTYTPQVTPKGWMDGYYIRTVMVKFLVDTPPA